jgi:hypothetical protein
LSLRTSIPRKSNKIKFAVSGIALAAAAAGAVSVWPASAAAQPSASAHPAASATLTLARQAAASVTQAETGLQQAAASQAAQLDTVSATLTASHRRLTPRQIARRMLKNFHWTQWQFRWLNLLWSRESGWRVHAGNPYSGAYGIPQAVPGSKMATAGPRWSTNPWTQIRWGLRYIKARYGSPHGAWLHELAYGWY